MRCGWVDDRHDNNIHTHTLTDELNLDKIVDWNEWRNLTKECQQRLKKIIVEM
jgi:hypothetical protein